MLLSTLLHVHSEAAWCSAHLLHSSSTSHADTAPRPGCCAPQYRTLRNYSCFDYLAARLFDKIIFALIVMSLYFGIADNFSPDNIPNMAALMYLCIAQPAWGAVSYIPAIMMGERQGCLYSALVHVAALACMHACMLALARYMRCVLMLVLL